MKCGDCPFLIGDKCTENTKNMDITCLMRLFLWSNFARQRFLDKIEKVIDDQNKDINNGEEWKK